jgi:hypothetical protein
VAILNVVRPLEPSTLISSDFGTAGDLCITACCKDLQNLVAIDKEWPLNKGYSVFVLTALYNSTITLINHLVDVKAHHDFTSGCRLLAQTYSDFSFSGFLLRLLKNLVEKMSIPVPDSASQYLDIPMTNTDFTDVPMQAVLPGHEKVLDLLDDDGEESSDMGIELGKVLSKWNRLTIL